MNAQEKPGTNPATPYAIVSIGCSQHKVAEGDTVLVDHIDLEPGSEVKFDKVLLTSGSEVKVGTPFVTGASVTAKVRCHLRGPKITVFKKKRRQGYTKKQGHRSELTQLDIVSI